MALILNLETATKTCSVSLAQNGKEILTKEITEEHFSHAENLNIFIQEVMKSAGKNLKELDAVAVSEGPGSYTGLRIGASTAKGLCYALDIPLIAVNSLKSLAVLMDKNYDLICPMFDAMRMEVYAAVYDQALSEIQKTQALIIEEKSFADLLSQKSILFAGPGAIKCQDMIKNQNAHFDLQTAVSAKGMCELSEQKFNAKEFEDLAYFEPFYLKDFVAGEKKNLL
ncbi:MAG: tRNA (adenosine(37)-N6)-threonylcarbamoyltransferase complex dimerization subunit type 1 TsaB [Crocinitomicaceae bacterium]|nr:tRNA (adenosine(37)-N6)-threonylcarbamoyltransferase complex dimerization subunit type 1 TsaB [Crocinitomicaceae bacterium]